MSNNELRVDDREISRYFTTLADRLMHAAVTSADGQSFSQSEAINHVMGLARRAHSAGNKLIFIGNGGSAAIASHMATDYFQEREHPRACPQRQFDADLAEPMTLAMIGCSLNKSNCMFAQTIRS